jgi:hypothetical protein
MNLLHAVFQINYKVISLMNFVTSLRIHPLFDQLFVTFYFCKVKALKSKSFYGQHMNLLHAVFQINYKVISLMNFVTSLRIHPLFDQLFVTFSFCKVKALKSKSFYGTLF